MIRFAGFLVLIISGCSASSDTKETIHPTPNNYISAEKITFSIGEENKSTSISDLLSNKEKVGSLGNSKKAVKELFSGIDAVQIQDQYVYVLDTREKRVAKFSLEGEYIEDIGKAGKGPGEFSYPNDLAEYAGDLFISDRLFSVKKAYPNNENTGVVNYLQLENISEGLCISGDQLVVKSLSSDSISSSKNMHQVYGLSTQKRSKSFGSAYKSQGKTVSEIMSEGLLECSSGGVIYSNYSLPYIHFESLENEDDWIAQIEGYIPQKFKETKERGLTNRWNNDDIIYDQFESINVSGNKVIVQVQRYESRIVGGKVKRNILELKTYSLDLKTGEGVYEGSDIPKIHYIDKEYVVVGEEASSPVVIIYKI